MLDGFCLSECWGLRVGVCRLCVVGWLGWAFLSFSFSLSLFLSFSLSLCVLLANLPDTGFCALELGDFLRRVVEEVFLDYCL